VRIAISATGRDLDSRLDSRFGRCPYFLVGDPETLEFEAVANPGASAGGGAGVKAAQELVDRGVQVVITGQCGPNAYDVLEAAGIKIFQAPEETLRRVLELYREGKLAQLNGPGSAKQGLKGWGSQ